MSDIRKPLQQFSDQSKYVKKYDEWTNDKSYDNATDFEPQAHKYRIGTTVRIHENHFKYGGLKGKVILGFSKDPEKIKIQFKDGKEAFVERYHIEKISVSDYNDDRDF